VARKRRPTKRKKEADGGRRIGRRLMTATTTMASGSYTGEKKIKDELRVRKT
jgi:hypothetical protein